MKIDKSKALSAGQIATIFDSINDGVFTVDMSWRITSFNRAAERITGVRAEEAVGRRCCDVFRASICESACALRSTLETGEPVVNQAVYIISATGQRVPISISTAVLKEKGKTIGGVETFRDLSQVEELHKQVQRQYTFADIISKNHRMQRLFDFLPQAADSDSTVLIEGESGTGKELFARAIHNLSRRREQPFVTVNCGAMPDTLLESELFGYRAGAFTDAREDRPGKFALAQGGTIFLDEIGDVSPAMQARLLRVLQERTFEPLGANAPVKADVRVVAVTNRSLADLVGEGAFRQDLYYRVDVLRMELPPLRDRAEDIPLLVQHFIDRFNRLRGKDVHGVSRQVMAVLTNHDYPGNVRELEHVIEHAFALCPGGLINVEHLPDYLRATAAGDAGPTSDRSLDKAEKQLILEALKRNQWNRQAAAKELGMHRSTMFRKITALGIELPSVDGRSAKA